MKRLNDVYNNSASWHYFITITSLVVSLICFALFYTKIEKMNNEIESVLNISIMKSDYLTKINDIIFRHAGDSAGYQKEIAGLYSDYVKSVFRSPISDAVKYEEEHFAENIYLKTRDLDTREVYHEIAINDNRFSILAKSLLDDTKTYYNRQLLILILIPTIMAFIRCVQAVYYFYSLRNLRGNYMIDPLTGVYNRRYMSKIRDSEGICYILAIDVDDFKSVNDNYGHAFGDRVLQECAHSMKLHIRDHDKVVRMGGDEFSIFLFKTDQAGAKIAASRVIDTINSLKIPLPEGGHFTPSLSIGVARCDGNVEKAMIQADQNLYISKRDGKNSFTFEGDK
ncbi:MULTISPECIES: GGDEF domain-containing protein [Cedecea]|uniref:diguanylate cyclase n=1 Tax=Cedecea davisae DSM 4568 TaxID=566551 RepID=S3JY83_9ENTR|nr:MULTISPECIES: GGDEF domain-containing protein [Cedecea]EPF18004.1 diguanylate cyclase domain protein [Cedecea davisae DSM 4568]QIX94381.1 GGDEF domain-containing protein [Cedecea sp. FDAARGOS_727]SUX28317.1 Diguanylate cyclase DosC [Cedecea davisae]